MESRKFWTKGRICLLAVVLLLGVVGWIAFQLQGSLAIYPEQDISVTDAVYYFQKDARWKDDTLGSSSYKMEDSGCLVTCLASVMEMQSLANLTPGELNRELSQSGGFDAEGNLQWEALHKLEVKALLSTAGEIRSQHLPSPEEQLQQGMYPIVRVRMYGIGSYHYVLLIGAEDGHFLCMDPLHETPEPVSLSRYGNRIYAVRILTADEISADS